MGFTDFATETVRRNSNTGSTQSVPASNSPERVLQSRKGVTVSRRGGKSSARIQWTSSLETELLRLYEDSQPSLKGYARRLENLWNETYPEMTSNGTALSTKVRRVLAKQAQGRVTSPQPSVNLSRPSADPSGSYHDVLQPPGEEEETLGGGTGGVVGPQTTSGVPSSDPTPLNPSNVQLGGSEASALGEGRRSDTEEIEVSEELLGEFLSVLGEWELCEEGLLSGRGKPRCKGVRVDAKLLREVDEIICTEWRKGEKTLWRLNCLVNAGAVVVVKRVKKPHSRADPGLRDRKAEIAQLRKVIGWLDSEVRRWKVGLRPTPKQQRLSRRLKKMFGGRTSLRELETLLETRKSLLRVRVTQERRLNLSRRRKRLNERYRLLGPQCLEGHGRTRPTNQPTREEVSEYWGGVIGVSGHFDPEDPAISGWKESLGPIPSSNAGTVDGSVWKAVLKRTRSWKAPGPDGICAFWWKVFRQAANLMWGIVQEIIGGNTEAPEWFVMGRTVLIPKEGCQGKADQYRPITCLNTGYKLLTAVITTILQAHVEEFTIIPAEQRALRKGRRGCLDALMIDSMVTQEAMLRRRNLSVAWIDYQKAYDRVPHGWLKLVLQFIGAPDDVRHCISGLLPKWKSTFGIGVGDDAVRVDLNYHRGLFQGDSLSPLLFCLCIAPLSHALRLGPGYKCVHLDHPMTHLLFMDDLKVYARSPTTLETALGVVDRVSRAVGMELGLRKCAVAHVASGRLTTGEDFILPEDRHISAVTNGNTYRYLGIEQVFKPDLKAIRGRLSKTYVKRLRKIWSSDLNSKHKVQATNVWAVSIFRYFYSHLKWSRRDLELLDRKTRAVMRQYKSHHYGASVERVYLPRRGGGRGLQSLVHSWEREIISTSVYLVTSSDPHLRAVVKHQLWLSGRNRYSNLQEAQRTLERLQVPLSLSESGVHMDREPVPPRQVSKMVKTAQMEALQEALCQKKIHGVFFKQCLEPDRDTSGCHIWLSDGRLRADTEALIVAAQDGVIHTRAYQVRVLKLDVPQTCRVCHSAPETVGHVLSCCEPLSWTLYKQRHDRVLYQMVLMLCKKHNITVPESLRWGPSGWDGVAVLEGSEVRLVVDLSIPTDRQLTERRPDLVAYYRELRRIVIYEVACAWEPLIEERQREKRGKYRELAADLATQWPGWKVQTTPVVVGDLGSLGSLREELSGLQLFTRKEILRFARNAQFEVLCSAVRILRRHLSNDGR